MTAYGLVDWVLRQDTGGGGSPVTRWFRCLAVHDDGTSCAAGGPAGGSALEARAWAFRHMREHPGHTSFTEVAERPWVMMGRRGAVAPVSETVFGPVRRCPALYVRAGDRVLVDGRWRTAQDMFTTCGRSGSRTVHVEWKGPLRVRSLLPEDTIVCLRVPLRDAP